jgi:hypothetical protein
MGKWVESGVKMMTADPLGKAFRADLSALSAIKIVEGAVRTSFGISEIAFWEPPEGEVKTFVDISNILLEVLSDFGELEYQL